MSTIERDKEIKKLISRFRPGLRWRLIIELGFAVVVAILIYALEKQFIPLKPEWVDIVVLGAGTAAATLGLKSIIDYLGVRYIKGKERGSPSTGSEYPLGPFDLWRPEVSGLSDAQGALMTSKFYKLEQIPRPEVSMLYSSRPYFVRVFINSIGLKFPKGSSLSLRYARKRYKSIFKSYVKKVVDVTTQNLLEEKKRTDGSCGKEEMAEISPKKSVSWQVFGIEFLSDFFYSLTESERQIRICIDEDLEVFEGVKNVDDYINDPNCDQKLKEEKKKKKLDGKACVIEFLRQCTAPENVLFVGKDEAPTALVARIELNEGRKFRWPYLENISRRIEGKSMLVVPVRKWVAVPNIEITGKSRDDPSSTNLPYSIFLKHFSGEGDKDDTRFIGVGGVEHNLALLYFINESRWSMKDDRWIGFAENKFDQVLMKYPPSRKVTKTVLLYAESRVGFKLGCEDYRKNDNRGVAGVFRFSLQSGDSCFHFIYFYGLSGLMTNVALMKYMDNPNQLKDDGRYIVKLEMPESEFGYEWDKLDAPNNPDKAEVRKLMSDVSIRSMDNENVVVFSDVKVEIRKGTIARIVLSNPSLMTEDSYSKEFENKWKKKFEKFKDNIRDNIERPEASHRKEQEPTTTEISYSGIIRYGGGHFLIIKDKERGTRYALLVNRDNGTPRGKGLLDVGAGLGDTKDPFETMIREVSEEFLIFKKDWASNLTRQIIFSLEDRSEFNSVVMRAATMCSNCCYENTEKIVVSKQLAVSQPPVNPVVVEVEGAKTLTCGAYFEEESLELVNVLTVSISGFDEDIEDYMFQDGEHSADGCLNRDILLINLETGSVRQYRLNLEKKYGSLRDYTERMGVSKENHKYATIKVMGIINNWDEKAWGDFSALEILKI